MKPGYVLMKLKYYCNHWALITVYQHTRVWPYVENKRRTEEDVANLGLILTQQQQQNNNKYNLYLPSAMFIAQVLVGSSKQLEQIIQIKPGVAPD